MEAAEAGRTLASILHGRTELSHSLAKGIIQAGRVQVDGEEVLDPALRPAAGARIVARYDAGTRYRARPRRRESTRWYRIVHDDRDLLVVNKVPGVLTVPAGGERGTSLLDRLVEAEPPGARGLWVVHRIDRWVSGLVVVARSPEALASLREQFARRTVHREYLGIVEGRPPEAAGRLVSWLVLDPRTKKLRPSGRSGEGQEAILEYRTRESLDRAALLEIRLETGRRNQIRVQMAEAGCPLLGDRAFGRASPLIRRVALHAARLRFRHPHGGREVELEAPVPGDFRRALARLRSGASRGDRRPNV